MYIEFFGLPGCGKTTLAKALAKRLKAEKMRPIYTISQINIWKAIKILPFFMHLFLLLLFHCPNMLTALFVRYYQYYNNQNCYISDHGFIQTLAQNNMLRKKLLQNKPLLKKLLFLIPKKDAYFICLDIPLEKTMKRIKKRRGKADELKYDIVKGHKQIFDMIKKENICSAKIKAAQPKQKILNQVLKIIS